MAVSITGDRAADALLSDNPFALIVGMVLDQQFPIERAFSSPKDLEERLGGKLDAQTVAATDPDRLEQIFRQRPSLHRFPASMAARVQALAKEIVDRHGGDTTSIWKGAQSGDELVQSLTALPGFGKQKAKIFAALLGKQFAVRPAGWIEATTPYGAEGAMLSVADIDSAETLKAVREHKRQLKAAAKSVVRTSDVQRPKTSKR